MNYDNGFVFQESEAFDKSIKFEDGKASAYNSYYGGTRNYTDEEIKDKLSKPKITMYLETDDGVKTLTADIDSDKVTIEHKAEDVSLDS